MKITFEKQGDIRILPVFADELPDEISEDTREWLTKSGNFTGKLGETYADIAPGSTNLILVGLGKRNKFDYDALRTMAYKALEIVDRLNIEQANFIVPEMNELADLNALRAIFEGALQNNYKFDKYKTEDKDKEKPDLSLCMEAQWIDGKEAVLEEMENIMEGVSLARDLINEPANVLTPDKLAQIAKEKLEPLGVKVTVYDEKEIEQLGMKAFLSVAKGSSNPPRFIKMEYLPEGDDKEAIVLVGKGLTFDSGGYSLKPTKSMVEMKTDMSGSASVIGALYALAKNKGEQNVVGLVAACENLISGFAYKPGDIVESMAGLTIEVDNTDAEGRITLADALYYAATEVNSKSIVDVATLTGACIVALGHVYSGAVTNNEGLYIELKNASEATGENIWMLPSHDIFREQLKGEFGDVKNVTERGAGTITAGLFLERFVEDKPWVHLDIAGTSYLKKAEGYLPKGATGVMVKTFYEFAK